MNKSHFSGKYERFCIMNNDKDGKMPSFSNS